MAKSYVYGNSIDAVLQMRDHASGEDDFNHQDDLFSVYAMTAEAGAGRATSSFGHRHTFTGRLLDDYWGTGNPAAVLIILVS